MENGDAAPLLVVNHIDGMEAVALAEHAVVGGGHTTTLGVAQVDGAGLITGLLLDNLSERLADAGEAGMAEGVYLRRTDDLADFRQMAAFSDDDDAIVLAVIVVVLEQGADVVDVDFFLGYQDDVGAAGNTGGVGDPAGVPEIRK